MYSYENIEAKIDDFLNSLPCQSDMKMPEGEVEGENLDYANMLLEAYSSSADSELQAITQYIYHHKTIGNKVISDTLMCIALVEMHHLDKLGDIIEQLGGKPAFYNSNRHFWNTGNIAYGDKDMLELKLNQVDTKSREIIKEKLQLNIKSEVNAINGYRFIKSNIEDKYIKAVLDKIISDEEVHIDILSGMIKKYL